MNDFVVDNFNRIFERDHTPEEVEEISMKGSESEILVIKVLHDMCYGQYGVTFYELWRVLSEEKLKRLSETNHVYKEALNDYETLS
jgi:hypothetical protein